MSFGNYAYTAYVVLFCLIALVLYLGYLLWKVRVLRRLIPRGDVREGLVRRRGFLVRLKEAALILAVLLFGVALLRPQWGEKMREVRKEGVDIMVALDVSRSMLARDVKPSRLSRAKDAVRFLAESARGDRMGLVLFAGDAFLQCPLTADLGAFQMFLAAAGPDSVHLQGTDLSRAFETAYRVFQKRRNTSRVLVMITDGEDHEGNVESAVRRFRELEVAVYTLGIGRENPELIPADGKDDSADIFLRDRSGGLVKTRRNTDLLKRISRETGGEYADITDSLSGVSGIVRMLSEQTKNEYGSRIVKERQERYQIFVLALILLLAAELFLPERRLE